MNKFLNFVQNGKGNGLKIILLLSLVIGALISVSIYTKMVNQYDKPHWQKIIEQIPELSIENGVIKSPVLSLQEVNLPKTSQYEKIIFDTTPDFNQDKFNTKNIYITPAIIFIPQNDSFIQYKIPPELNDKITPDALHNYIKSSFVIMSISMGLIFMLCATLGFLFTLFFVYSFGFIVKENLPFALWGRLVVFPWIICLTGYAVAIFIGLNISIYYLFLIPFLLALLGATYITKKQ